MSEEKSFKRKLLERVLRFMARKVLARHKPKVVAVTGSVGKTTTKEMIWHVLSASLEVRKNEKNYNNEVGVPLTIIGAETGKRSLLAWVKIFFKWLGVLIFPKYPEVLVLEMGADRPGDIKYLCDFVPIDVGILTNVSISHLEYFKTKKSIEREKARLVKSVPVGGLAVCNFDNSSSREISEQLKVDLLTYGLEEGAKMRASDINFSYQTHESRRRGEMKIFSGLNFKLNFQGKIIPVKLVHGMGLPQVQAALAAFSVSQYFKLNLIEVARAVENFSPPGGRMVHLDGIKHSTLIDDTYNSSPESTLAAFETVKKIEAQRKIAVLGDMLELGPEEESSHAQIGKEVARLGFDYFVAVGKRMKVAFEAYQKLAEESSPGDENAKINKATWFDSPEKAKFFVQDLIREGDLVLIKGSQGMRMEKVVEEVMAQPDQKEQLLTRQDKEWQEKPFVKP